MSQSELERDYLAEARLIWANRTMMIPEKEHINALFDYILKLETEQTEMDDKFKELEREVWFMRVPTGERDSA